MSEAYCILGNTFRINFRAFDVVIRNSTDETTICEFVVGALVRPNEPTPVAVYKGGNWPFARREAEAGPWRIETVDDPSILERYQGKVPRSLINATIPISSTASDGNLTETSDLSKRQNGLEERLAQGCRIRMHLFNGTLGDVWRVTQVSTNLDSSRRF